MFYSLVNKILQSTLRIYVERLFDLNERPIQTQEEILLDFIAKAKNTAFGRLHHFDSIHDYKDYVSKVPLHEYGDLKPYINQMRHGDKDILWPGKVDPFPCRVGRAGERRSELRRRTEVCARTCRRAVGSARRRGGQRERRTRR